MNVSTDDRIVMTLDAGGTNFVFSAMQANKEIVEPISLPSEAHDLDKCLGNIVKGFQEVKDKLKATPVAISFAFPGPADYPNGIIGNLQNLPSFRGGIALGPMLEKKFNIPVFINNDGDLFVYGEAIAGFLPDVNSMLAKEGSPKQYKNLFGITLGTGFGGGIVRNNELFIGDNSAGGEIWVMRNKKHPRAFAEEGASIRAVQRVYGEHSGEKNVTLTPKEIFDIAEGTREGNQKAALVAFEELGEVVGDALANAITLIDGLIVIGGGLTGAFKYIMPSIIREMNGTIESLNGEKIDRIALKAFNLEDKEDIAVFLHGDKKKIVIPYSNETVFYDSMKRIGVGLSKLGTSKAVSIGAYAYALNRLNKI
ncbi:MAG: ROK family protein [Bacteroidota bacterium]